MSSTSLTSVSGFAAFALLLVAFCSQTALSQQASSGSAEDRKAILATIQAFFDTTETKDVKGAKEIFAEKGRFYSVRVIDGKKVVRTFSNQEHLDGLPDLKDRWVERMWDPTVLIRGDIATVWTPYDFWINGKFTHCGIDSVTLVRIEGKWKLTGGAYTVEKECEPSPLGPLKK